MTDNMSDDFFKPFGGAKWKEFQETVRASDLQLRFAVARFNGSTASAAAKIAGYAGDKDELRRAGYSATRSTAVVALIELAETNAPEAAGLTDAEVDAKVAKLVRSPDPQISLKATELFDRRKQRKAELNAAKPEESLEENLAIVIALVPESGCGAFLALSSFIHGGGFIGSFPFLAEVAPIISRHFPGDWQRWRAREKQQWVTDFLEKAAAGPVLEDDALIDAVKGKAPKIKPNPTKEITDAD